MRGERKKRCKSTMAERQEKHNDKGKKKKKNAREEEDRMTRKE